MEVMLMKRKLFFTVVISIFVTSCAFLEHRSYVDQMNQQTAQMFVPGEDFPIVPGDEGQAFRSKEEIFKRTPLSKKEQESYLYEKSIQTELATKERGLTPQEYKEYQQNWDYLKTTYEKLYYLNLPRSQRYRYSQSWRTPAAVERSPRTESFISFYQNPVQDRESIRLGMSKDEVASLWGRPYDVEIAGNPDYQNERWAFYNGQQVMYVFFEKGRVEGWTNR